ncbi:hypothetical protein [Providencia manganoxydans]|uniref:hypothetical protein n=1 Tax=Providencia manganoxydans TaxID=2923283 RepID=UPI00292956A5|nr:hypothetical protein [Providencia rettgeri]HEM6871591.1 type 1 fimbrial protein [Providencia stuartii]HEM7175266.1 type 1 fimbrial protein [Providencia stuartii]
MISKLVKFFNKRIPIIILLPLVVPTSSVNAADSSSTTLTITARVNAVCTVTPSVTSISLPDIPYSEFEGKTRGTELPNYASEQFELSGKCSGTSKFKYTFIPSNYENQTGCIDAKGLKSLYFCVYSNNKKIDFKNGTVEMKGLSTTNNGVMKFKIIPATGDSPIKVQQYSASLTVKIEPE